ncbi:hypothetical protein CALCODRAFT_504848, partial [Calocera cornea HHB12733]
MGQVFQTWFISEQDAARQKSPDLDWPEPLSQVDKPLGPELISILEEYQAGPSRVDRERCFSQDDPNYGYLELCALYSRLHLEGYQNMPLPEDGKSIMTLAQSCAGVWTKKQYLDYYQLATNGRFPQPPPYYVNPTPCDRCAHIKSASRGRVRICFGDGQEGPTTVPCISCIVMGYAHGICRVPEQAKEPRKRKRMAQEETAEEDSAEESSAWNDGSDHEEAPSRAATPRLDRQEFTTSSAAWAMQVRLQKQMEVLALATRRNSEVLMQHKTGGKGPIVLWHPSTRRRRRRPPKSAAVINDDQDADDASQTSPRSTDQEDDDTTRSRKRNRTGQERDDAPPRRSG